MRFNSIKTVLYVLPFLLFATQGLAQKDSDNDLYIVSTESGCSPLSFSVSNNTSNNPTCPCNSTCPCDIVQIEGSSETVLGQIPTDGPSITLSNPGDYTIGIRPNTTSLYDDFSITVAPNEAPDFSVFNCSARKVQLVINDNAFDNYAIDWGDGSNDVIGSGTKNIEHTFPNLLDRIVTVRGTFNNSVDNCVDGSVTTQVVTLIVAPFIKSLEMVDAQRANLTFTSIQSLNYDLEIAVNQNSGFAVLETVTGLAGQDVTLAINNRNLDFENNYYCFRLVAIDACDASNTRTSNSICSINSTLTLQSNENRVKWGSNTGINSTFRVIRNSAEHASVAGSQLFYNDTDNVVCNTEYCYQVIGVYEYAPGVEVLSFSNTVCGTSFSEEVPPAVENISTQVQNNTQVQLYWEASSFALGSNPYRVYRGNSTEASEIDQTTNTEYLDATVGSVPSSLHYQINYQDQCLIEAEQGALTQILYLTAIEKQGVVALNWNNFTGWVLGVDHYQIDRITSGGVLIESINNGLSTQYEYDISGSEYQQEIFRVTAFAADNSLQNSISNTASIIKTNPVLVSSAFTPNGDGLNDEMVISTRFAQKVSIEIFNRWGELLYANADLPINNDGLYSAWDGTFNGKLLGQNAYTYKVTILDELNRNIVTSGNVMLLK